MRKGSTRLLVVAGITDAGMASLAGFLAAIYAAHVLQPALLGAYAVYFSAFVFGGFVSANLYLLQSRVAALACPQEQRIGILPQSLLSGALFSGLAAAWTPFAGIMLLGELSTAELAPLALGAAALVFFSPLQDHLRATCHLSGRSSRAVQISGCQLGFLALSLIALHLAPVSHQWVPFGSLAIANMASLSLGVWLSRDDLKRYKVRLPPIRRIVTPGWSLLLVALVPALAQFAGSALVASLKSAELAGYAEAARVVATPVHVLALGIAQALTPALMYAGQTGSARMARRNRILFLLPLLACALVYLPLVGFSHFVNPMALLLPNAYHLQGLVLLSAVSLLILDVGIMPRAELAGAERVGDLVRPALAGSVVHVASVAALMWWLGAYAIPLGILVSNGILLSFALARASGLYQPAARRDARK
ncbi:MAG TPA: hypothetical protein VJB57_14890 [Dehalococcoidia bacterium]|nr:hypothetical protein [Dehalococcoidia bacterium]